MCVCGVTFRRSRSSKRLSKPPFSKQKETTVTYVFKYLMGNLLVIPLNACKVTCCFNVKYHLRVVNFLRC